MLNPLKVARGLRAIARLTADPTQLEEVFVLADLAEGSPELVRLVDELKADPRFSRIFIDRPRLGKVDLNELDQLPEGTIGREYAKFMRARGLDHESLLLIDGESDADFFRNHMRETHDLWHVATGFDTDVAGELGLQAFYLAHFAGPLPVLLLAVGMLNTLFKSMDDADRRLHAMTRGYLLGKRSQPLVGIQWSARWHERLEDLRRERNLEIEEVDRILAEKRPEVALRAAA
jgi:ubiquinone biosynthesis protein COQ4